MSAFWRAGGRKEETKPRNDDLRGQSLIRAGNRLKSRLERAASVAVVVGLGGLALFWGARTAHEQFFGRSSPGALAESLRVSRAALAAGRAVFTPEWEYKKFFFFVSRYTHDAVRDSCLFREQLEIAERILRAAPDRSVTLFFESPAEKEYFWVAPKIWAGWARRWSGTRKRDG